MQQQFHARHGRWYREGPLGGGTCHQLICGTFTQGSHWKVLAHYGMEARFLVKRLALASNCPEYNLFLLYPSMFTVKIPAVCHC